MHCTERHVVNQQKQVVINKAVVLIPACERKCVFDWLLQSDREKEQGLPVAPFMDREKVTKPTAQIGFIKFVLTPMFESVAKVSFAVAQQT